MAGGGEMTNINVLVIGDENSTDVTQLVQPNSNITSKSLEQIKKQGKTLINT